MSKPVRKTQPKRKPVHWASPANPMKGYCGKRGYQTDQKRLVTCEECEAFMHKPAPKSVCAAMRKMIGGNR